MIRTIFLTLILLFSETVYSDADLQAKVNQLDMYSNELLGISIFAVAELIRLKNTPHFLTLDYIKSTGEIERYTELEKKGYIESKIIKGLPGGEMIDQEFLWVIRTDEGEELMRCFSEAKYNQSLKATSKSGSP